MLVAFCDHVVGNSTSVCSKDTLPPCPMRASRRSHVDAVVGMLAWSREDAADRETLARDDAGARLGMWRVLHFRPAPLVVPLTSLRCLGRLARPSGAANRGVGPGRKSPGAGPLRVRSAGLLFYFVAARFPGGFDVLRAPCGISDIPRPCPKFPRGGKKSCEAARDRRRRLHRLDRGRAAARRGPRRRRARQPRAGPPRGRARGRRADRRRSARPAGASTQALAARASTACCTSPRWRWWPSRSAIPSATTARTSPAR